jgi:hypothetical protein
MNVESHKASCHFEGLRTGPRLQSTRPQVLDLRKLLLYSSDNRTRQPQQRLTYNHHNAATKLLHR